MPDVNKVIGLDFQGNLPGLTGLTPPSPAIDLGLPPSSLADVVAQPANATPINIPAPAAPATPSAPKTTPATAPVKTGGDAAAVPTPTPTAPTPAKPAEPFNFNGFYAQRMKEQGGYLTKRDLAKENEALGKFGQAYGRMPKSNDDWKLIHNALYGGTQFMEADAAADALDQTGGEGGGMDNTGTGTETATTDAFGTPTLDSVFESLGITKLEAKDYTAEKEAVEKMKENRLASLSYEFAEKRKAQSEANKKVSDTLKAKLIKMGVPLDSTSYISANEGQDSRNNELMRQIDREEARQRAVIESDYLKSTTDLSIAERNEAMNVNIQNINNMLQGYDLAKNIWSVFLNRDENEKKLEQQAKDSLLDFQVDMMKMNQEDRKTRLGMIENFLTEGMYDMMDENNVRLLTSVEKFNQLEPGELVNAGVGGYNKRLAEMALKEAQAINTAADTEQKIAQTTRIKTLLPAELEKMRAQTAKLLRSGTGSGSGGGGNAANATSALKSIEDWFGANATGADGRIDSAKYLNQLNGFVAYNDPKLKNEKYWKTVFYTYFPPQAVLNPNKEDDPISANLNRDFEATLRNPDTAGFDVNVYTTEGDDLYD